MNKQTIEKLDYQKDGSLVVHSIFYTIQGEGPFAGQPAVFVRLAGCNLQCPLCDTMYVGGDRYSPTLLVEKIEELLPVRPAYLQSYPNLVVITGGEPFRQNLGPFVEQLYRREFQIQIETNGTLYQPFLGYYDEEDLPTIVCSPKTPKLNQDLLPYIKAYKYVAGAGYLSDVDGLPFYPLHDVMDPGNGHVARPHEGFTGKVYLQPLDEKDFKRNERNLEVCIQSCMRYGYNLCLQIHKIVGLE